MKKLINFLLTITVVTLAGCSNNYGTAEVDADSVGNLETYKTGIISSIKHVVIKDDGTGRTIGAVTGAVLGAVLFKGAAGAVAAVGGGVAGYYAGKDLGKSNGQELTITLDSGGSVVTITKGHKFAEGQHVRIVMEGDKVTEVDHN
jgi:outer membrane lipoprotein SlyB